MRCDFFTIPVQGGGEDTEALNRLLSSARILTVDRNFVAEGANSFWSVCVVSQTGGQRSTPAGRRPSVDYRQILNDEDFAVYARLRELRKTIAAREGIPPYSVFTNEQLAEIVRQHVRSVAGLKGIAGVGDARADKYGNAFLSLLGANPSPAALAHNEA